MEITDPLKEFEPHYRYFLDQSTVLFGESKTGKSVIIMDILHSLKDHIDLAVVFSPTDQQNGIYSKTVPKPLIHYKVTAQTITTLWERQKAVAATYKNANDPEVLQSLLSRVPNRDFYAKIRAKIAAKKREHLETVRESLGGAHAEIVEKEYERLDDLWVKKVISEHSSSLLKMRLSDREKYALKYIDLNPRLCVVFDDCTDQIKRINKCPAVQELFYQGRHNYVTFIIGCHHDKTLDPELKKNIFVSIYTAQETAAAYIERASTAFDRATKMKWRHAIAECFGPGAGKWQKLVWIREEKKFYKWTATPHDDFQFCCGSVWDFCKAIEATETRVDNAFSRDFA